MRRTDSIRFRLALVFLLLLVLVMVLGLSSLDSLRHFNEVSAQIRDRWLPSAHALVHLNNDTSDFRAAEAALLLAEDTRESLKSERDMGALDRTIAAAALAYRQVPHDVSEVELFGRFEAEWRAYRTLVAQIRLLVAANSRTAAVHLYATTSQDAYDAASATLDLITDRNVASARQASLGADLAYAAARHRIVISIILAALLIVGAMANVRRSISMPLLGLASRMHRLAANETSVQMPDAHRRDEIGEMARAVLVFRDNAIDLAASRHSLARQASILQEKLAQEQRLTSLQRNFVSMASHEFRTPLTIIDGHAQRLISTRERLGPHEISERAGKVRSAVQRMTQLIDNLIGSARVIDEGIDHYIQLANVDLTHVLREACRLHRDLGPSVQILELMDPPPLIVSGDAGLLLQVFGNLLSNAVKYSPEGGLIKLSARREPPYVVVAVEDRGIGMCAEDQARIFERYFRGSNTSGIGGSGVGLYLVKMMIDLHGGAITVHSRLGKGSRFTVRLPLQPAISKRPRAPARDLTVADS
jgi:two-component system OmpR family sensor kinase